LLLDARGNVKKRALYSRAPTSAIRFDSKACRGHRPRLRHQAPAQAFLSFVFSVTSVVKENVDSRRQSRF